MTPDWLLAPPIGLTEAERRVLEGFFVAEEVKAAAELLRLSPKTIQNELLLARQTMGESKSWMAAIRYVFHAKRQGHSFTELQLVPKIDRQIRRLIDDYLEATESEPVAENAAQEVRQNQGWTQEPRPEPWPEETNTRAILPVGSFELVPEEQFEAQLSALVRVAANVYERPARLRRRRLVTTLVTLGVAATAVLGYFATRDNSVTIEQIEARLEKVRTAIVTGGETQSNMTECANAVDELCTKYWEELWGKREESVVAVFKHFKPVIEAGATWAHDHDKRLALKIYGNGHRAFRQSEILQGIWIDQLRDVVRDNGENRSVYMVRALCGVIYGCLNDGDKSKKFFSPQEQSETQALAIQRLRQIMNRNTDPYDYANALRHIAMTKSDPKLTQARTAECEEAMAIYVDLKLHDPSNRDLADRGIANCLLSIAESQMPSIDVLKKSLIAYGPIKKLENPYLEGDCIRLANLQIPNVSGKGAATVMKQLRRIDWEYAERIALANADRQFELLKNCADIDDKYDTLLLPGDVQELVVSEKSKDKDSDVLYQLAGFAFRQLEDRGIPPHPRLLGYVNADGRRSKLVKEGMNWSPSKAADAVKSWGPKKPVSGFGN